MSHPTPLRLIVMGVSGCGKTTLTQALAAALGLRAVDGDDLHQSESVRKMSAGIALTDEDRWPWLQRVATSLGSKSAGDASEGCVVACAAPTAPTATPCASACQVYDSCFSMVTPYCCTSA